MANFSTFLKSIYLDGNNGDDLDWVLKYSGEDTLIGHLASRLRHGGLVMRPNLSKEAKI